MAASLTDLTNLASRARRIGWWNGIVGVPILAAILAVPILAC